MAFLTDHDRQRKLQRLQFFSAHRNTGIKRGKKAIAWLEVMNFLHFSTFLLLFLLLLINVEATLGEFEQASFERAAAVQLKSMLTKGKGKQAIGFLRHLMARDRERRLQKCAKLLSPAICKHANAQPFYVWAHIAAQKMVRHSSEDMTKMILNGRYRFG